MHDRRPTFSGRRSMDGRPPENRSGGRFACAPLPAEACPPQDAVRGQWQPICDGEDSVRPRGVVIRLFGSRISRRGSSAGGHPTFSRAISPALLCSPGPLAHPEEQGTFNPKVPGSRPGRPTESGSPSQPTETGPPRNSQFRRRIGLRHPMGIGGVAYY